MGFGSLFSSAFSPLLNVPNGLVPQSQNTGGNWKNAILAQMTPWQPSAEQMAQFHALPPDQQAEATRFDPNQATNQGGWGSYQPMAQGPTDVGGPYGGSWTRTEDRPQAQPQPFPTSVGRMGYPVPQQQSLPSGMNQMGLTQGSPMLPSQRSSSGFRTLGQMASTFSQPYRWGSGYGGR